MSSIKLKIVNNNNNKIPTIKVKRLVPITFFIVVPKCVSNVSNETIIRRKISQCKKSEKKIKSKKRIEKIKRKKYVKNTKLCKEIRSPQYEPAISNLIKYLNYDNDGYS